MPWVLTFHLFGVIFWLGGLLVITSLLALVADEVGVAKERFIVAARRLFIGCNIGAAVAIVFGFVLIAFEPEVMRQGWFHTEAADGAVADRRGRAAVSADRRARE